MLGSKINKRKRKQIQRKEKKLKFVLIQNVKILKMFVCLPAKLQLFQEYRALIKIFFHSRSKKACVFQVERLPKKSYDVAKEEKSLYSGGENGKLNTVAKIDMDALEVF